jgi:hypothetical protein
VQVGARGANKITYSGLVDTRLADMTRDVTEFVLEPLPVSRNRYRLRYESLLLLRWVLARFVNGNG